jgi:protein-S-isoprenylcysteine O-methyltransferase Ste14
MQIQFKSPDLFETLEEEYTAYRWRVPMPIAFWRVGK